jgi:hypothetical protein
VALIVSGIGGIGANLGTVDDGEGSGSGSAGSGGRDGSVKDTCGACVFDTFQDAGVLVGMRPVVWCIGCRYMP